MRTDLSNMEVEGLRGSGELANMEEGGQRRVRGISKRGRRGTKEGQGN